MKKFSFEKYVQNMYGVTKDLNQLKKHFNPNSWVIKYDGKSIEECISDGKVILEEWTIESGKACCDMENCDSCIFKYLDCNKIFHFGYEIPFSELKIKEEVPEEIKKYIKEILKNE